MTVRVKVEGLRDLDRALGQLKPALAKGVLRRVAVKALQPFDKAWREKAPHLTGNLEDSGGVGTKLTRRQAQMNRRREDRDTVEVFAGPNDPAAVPEEFGWENGRAQPFVRPAWDETKHEALEIVKRELGPEITRTAERAARRAAGGRR
ncbi:MULTISPECIES: hypothetical protein [Sphingomonas]|jgi:hypothetical protein|uniref:HK97 gp10 family phage protein n=1 Tax=Sphingomonas zeae TaxID=1646122 RepID=A0A7Y6B217_9SPHN|nr:MULTISPECIES: hypothetical protein [Sphingomonas]MBB4049620.1 hypothetical protein [Sphingomonas zeae]MDK8188007.1 hypothetical protein [Sphingomonas zeae]MDK8217925.1 hypothetical protein [Sphingomonas sp. UMB7805-LC452B]NUU46002.1 hypothetical protein [Sphingomonas zeae]